MYSFFTMGQRILLNSRPRLLFYLLFCVGLPLNVLAQLINESYSSTNNLKSDKLTSWENRYPWTTNTVHDVWVRLYLYSRSNQSVLKIAGYYESAGLCRSKDCQDLQIHYPLLRPPYQATPQTVIFNLKTKPYSDTTIYLRLTKVSSKPAIQFLAESDYLHSTEKEIFVSALFCGIILAIIITTFYYFITEKKILYQCYALYITFLFLSPAIHLNILAELLINAIRYLTDKPDLIYIEIAKTVNLAALLTALRFAYIFFDIKNKSITLSLVFKIQAVLTVLTYLYVFLTPVPEHRFAVFGITILTFILLITTSWYLWIRHQKRSYLIYNLAYLLFFIGYLVNVYTIITKLFYSPIFFVGGTLFETLLLSFTLVLNIHEEKKQTKLNLIKTTEELLSRINEFERFSNILAHNLRAPIARIIGLKNLLMTLPHEKQAEVVNLIGKTVDDLDFTVRKIRKILDIKKERVIIFEPVNIQAEVDKLIPKIEDKAKETGADVSIALKGNEVIMANEEYVSSILCNILENCFKFREPSRKLKVEVTSDVTKDDVLIHIKDTGTGFPLNEVNHKLFEPFQRFHNNVEGKGLGLYFAKVLMEKLKGEILVESIPNRGTTFTLRFPKRAQKFKNEIKHPVVIPDFVEAKEKHLAWMYRINQLLNGEKNAISMDAAISHYQCDLGKWFYSEGKAKFGHIQKIQEFEKVHILLHMLTKEIIMAAEKGDMKTANEQFEKLQVTSQQLLKLLTEVEKIACSLV